jgi:hypothetical protein
MANMATSGQVHHVKRLFPGASGANTINIYNLLRDIDSPAAAEALKQAASDGVPFCEKCTRTPAAAEPQKDSQLKNVDAARMAQAMKDAAHSGVPFCEKCAGAKPRMEEKAEQR